MTSQPVRRRPDVRRGRNVGKRAVNVEAYMAQHVGNFARRPCRHCSKSLGPFLGCVLVPGLFTGSYANCHFGGEDVRCSFRKLRTVTAFAGLLRGL